MSIRESFGNGKGRLRRTEKILKKEVQEEIDGIIEEKMLALGDDSGEIPEIDDDVRMLFTTEEDVHHAALAIIAKSANSLCDWHKFKRNFVAMDSIVHELLNDVAPKEDAVDASGDSESAVIEEDDTVDSFKSPIFCSDPECEAPEVPLRNYVFCPFCGIKYCSDNCKARDFLLHRFRVCIPENPGRKPCFFRRLRKNQAASIWN